MLGRELAEQLRAARPARRRATAADRPTVLRGGRPAPRPRARRRLAVDPPRRGRRPGRAARVRALRDGARHLRRGPARRRHDRPSTASRCACSRRGTRSSTGSACCAGGPQGRGHHPAALGPGEHDAGPAAAPAPPRHRRPRRASSRDRRPLHQGGSASSAPARTSRSASCPAATSRRCCSPAGCAPNPKLLHPRRAHPRHRRRRQARDPGAGRRARRRGPGGAPDLLGARGAHRRLRPGRGACATAHRSPSSTASRSPRRRCMHAMAEGTAAETRLPAQAEPKVRRGEDDGPSTETAPDRADVADRPPTRRPGRAVARGAVSPGEYGARGAPRAAARLQRALHAQLPHVADADGRPAAAGRADRDRRARDGPRDRHRRDRPLGRFGDGHRRPGRRAAVLGGLPPALAVLLRAGRRPRRAGCSTARWWRATACSRSSPR